MPVLASWPRSRRYRARFPEVEGNVGHFEKFVATLAVPPEEWSQHPEIQKWVKRHAHRYYVPEDLLCELGITPEQTLRWA